MALTQANLEGWVLILRMKVDPELPEMLTKAIAIVSKLSSCLLELKTVLISLPFLVLACHSCSS